MTTALKNHLVKQIGHFDPICLLRLLAQLGYTNADILFRSHFSLCSQSRLIESIQFQSAPVKKVLITLNLGLLGGQSLLPNYLFKQVHENLIDEQGFSEFFGYFDDRLLRRFFLAIYPECDESLVPNWETRKNQALQTLKLDSSVSLHWLTQQVFPELQVRVQKVSLERRVDLGAPILGKTKLGYQTVFGKIKKIPVAGKRITLISDEADFKLNQPWPNEIEQRLQKLLFPCLTALKLDLEIWLLICNQSTWLSLKQNSYLGYENVVSEQAQFQSIRIFSGVVTSEK